jgi:hypothetical protein
MTAFRTQFEFSNLRLQGRHGGISIEKHSTIDNSNPKYSRMQYQTSKKVP